MENINFPYRGIFENYYNLSEKLLQVCITKLISGMPLTIIEFLSSKQGDSTHAIYIDIYLLP